MWLLIIPLVLAVLYYGLRYYFTRTFNYWKKRNVAGPEPIPIFGNMKDLNLRKKNITLVYKEIYDQFPKEKVVGIFRMITPTILVRDLDLIKHIMIRDFENFADRGLEFSTKGLGLNLFHSDGEHWRALRSRFSPVFTSGKIKAMFYLLEERADKFLEYVENQCQSYNEFEIHKLVQKYTVSTISACAFGVDIDTLNDKMESLALLDKLIFTPSFVLELDMMYPGLLKKLNLSVFPAKVQTFFADLVSRISAERNGKPSSRNDFMDLMLALRDMGSINYNRNRIDQKEIEITDSILAGQAFVFYAAGYETSATTVTYLLYELALHPEIQNKVIEEIDAVTKANNGKMTYESLSEMKYLNQVFSETLRKHPIVDPLQRVAKHDYQIPGTDVVIKKGQLVFISARGIHYDETHYPNPEVFDPERFAPEVAGARHPCAYLPFGVGPRNCIGMRFGKVQSRLCVAKLLSKFRVEASARTNKNLGIEKNRVLAGPTGGVYLNLVPRSK